MILSDPHVIREETLQHNIMWVAVTVDRYDANHYDRVLKFARRMAHVKGYDGVSMVSSGASSGPDDTEYRYGYVLTRDTYV